VARNKEQYQKVCPRMYQVSTEQGTIYEKGRRTSSIGNTGRTMVRN